MKRLILAMAMVAAMGAAVAASAAPWASTESLAGGSVALTNSQANSVWAPVAVLWKFSAATNATVTVVRVSQGAAFLVSSQTVVNASTAIWIPEAPYPFAVGEVLRVTCTATNGVVQIIRKGE